LEVGSGAEVVFKIGVAVVVRFIVEVVMVVFM